VIPGKWHDSLRAVRRRVCFHGWRYQCVFCGSRLRKLLPYGLDLPVLRDRKWVAPGERWSGIVCPPN